MTTYLNVSWLYVYLRVYLLLSKCTECRYFTLTPSREPTVKRLAISLDGENRAMTHNSMEMPAIAIAIVSNSSTHVNGSLCQIASLEVYRGMTQTTKIRHVGFVLNNKGAFEVRTNFNNSYHYMYTGIAFSDKSKPTCL